MCFPLLSFFYNQFLFCFLCICVCMEIRSINKKVDGIRGWWSGPWLKEDCAYEWVGPYDTKADAESDRVGVEKFLENCPRGGLEVLDSSV